MDRRHSTIVPRSSTARTPVAGIFEDPGSQALLERIRQVSQSNATVLISGDTGTGKEVVARYVHDMSPRANKPFVAVNCGALAESLAESELFGHERGAFTGANGPKVGWFEAAHGGTLFLDEVGDLTQSVQVKLLRVLQEREVARLGSRRAVPVDVRLIAATNVDLAQATRLGRFREDLYYRLRVAVLSLPPLHERPADIIPLAYHFIEKYREGLPTRVQRISPAAAEALTAHPWPGNVRELENVVHAALIVCRGDELLPEDLQLQPHLSSARSIPDPLHQLERALVAAYESGMTDLLAGIERKVTLSAYEYCGRNQVATARLFGVSRNVVRARLVRCGELVPGGPKPGTPYRR
jgi:sigma-54-specific transcriptional regulator